MQQDDDRDPELEGAYDPLMAQLDAAGGGSGGPAPTPSPAPTSAPQQGGGSDAREEALRRVQSTYQGALGRAASDRELASESENLRRYSFDSGPYGGVEAQIRARATNQPNNGQNAKLPYTSSAGGSTGGGGGGSDAMSALLAYLQTRDMASQTKQSGLHDILMSLLGQYQQPVSAEQPGIRDALAGQRVASQRAAERQKAQAAEGLAYRGLGRSGALDATLQGIEQQRGEGDTKLTGQLLYTEMNNRRQAIQQLLSTAIASGDSESARLLAGQLEAIRAQMQQSQFGAAQAQQQGQFNDTLGFNYNQLNSGMNLNALMSLLGGA